LVAALYPHYGAAAEPDLPALGSDNDILITIGSESEARKRVLDLNPVAIVSQWSTWTLTTLPPMSQLVGHKKIFHDQGIGNKAE